jgi:hypothetical protein
MLGKRGLDKLVFVAYEPGVSSPAHIPGQLRQGIASLNNVVPGPNVDQQVRLP